MRSAIFISHEYCFGYLLVVVKSRACYRSEIEGVAGALLHVNIAMSGRAVVLFYAAWLWLEQRTMAKFCPKVEGKPTCVCETDEGTIDLTSLVTSETEPA